MIWGPVVVAISAASPHIYLTAWDVPGDPAPVLAASQQSAAPLARHPGFAGAAWLTRRPGPVAATRTRPAGGSGTRVVEWFQWSTARQAQDAENAGLGGSVGPVREHAGLYELQGVVTASGVASLDLAQHAGGLTLMLLGESADPKQACELVMREANENIKHLPGFIGAAFLLAADGPRMAEIIRWESQQAFEAATANPRFKARIAEGAKVATAFDGGAYDLAAAQP